MWFNQTLAWLKKIIRWASISCSAHCFAGLSSGTFTEESAVSTVSVDGFTRPAIIEGLCSDHSRKREQQRIKYLAQGTTWPLGQDERVAFLCWCVDWICSPCWRCAPNQPFQAVIRTWWMSQPVKRFVKYMLTLFAGISAAPQTFTGNEAWLVLVRLRKVMRHKEAGQQVRSTALTRPCWSSGTH